MGYDYISFYQSHGVEDLKREGIQYLGWCPFHSDKGSERKGFSANPSSGLWFCHSCNTGGNVFDFCKSKGISPEEAPGHDPQYRKYSYQKGIKKKHNTEKSKISWEESQGKDKTPYNTEDIAIARETKRRLWICEGEKDTETMHSAGELAIGTPSASDLGGIDKIDFREIEKIILAFDNDDAGKSATDKVLKNIPWANVVKWPEDKPTGYDITDCFKEGEGFLETLEVLSEGPQEPNLGEYLRKKYDLSQTREPDIPLGYFLTTFKPLQENIDGVQPGLYIVGADTSYGKTSFVANLYLDLLQSNRDLTGIYFSLDDNKDIIINRLLAILSGLPINLIQKRIDDETPLKKLIKAYIELGELSSNQRLYIYDQADVDHVNKLEAHIKKNLRRKLFVVVDGLFNLDVEEGMDGSIRGLNIERANALKRLVDLYQIPLICTAELRKSSKGDSSKIPTPDDIMETGKFKYNANLILLLYPEDKEAYDNEDKPILKIKYAKNKLSHYRKTDQVTFLRSCSRMKDMKRS